MIASSATDIQVVEKTNTVEEKISLDTWLKQIDSLSTSIARVNSEKDAALKEVSELEPITLSDAEKTFNTGTCSSPAGYAAGYAWKWLKSMVAGD